MLVAAVGAVILVLLIFVIGRDGRQREEAYQQAEAAPVFKEPRIMVGTKSSYDDLGKVLESINISYGPVGNLNDCDVLFLNCMGSAPDKAELRRFVEEGGCVFASCTQCILLQETFPESIKFVGIGFKYGTEIVAIEDPELRSIVGDSMEINFHEAGSGNPVSGNFKTIMRGCGNVLEYGTNICVRATYGKGSIFFTMFHNSDNINEKEKALLQLLVLKEIASSQNINIEEAGEEFGVDIENIKSIFRSN
jgi:hypothetical protein